MMIIVASTITLGCSPKKVEFFHGRYPNFRPGPPGGVDLVEIKRGVDFKAYKTIMLSPVSLHFNSHYEYTVIPPYVLQKLRDAFDKALVDAIGDAYTIVNMRRPDALRVRIAITGLVPLIQDTASDIPISIGGASIKAQLIDSMTGERLVAAIDTKTGYEQKALKTDDEWEHTKDVFRFWAQKLRNWLDRTYGKK